MSTTRPASAVARGGRARTMSRPVPSCSWRSVTTTSGLQLVVHRDRLGHGLRRRRRPPCRARAEKTPVRPSRISSWSSTSSTRSVAVASCGHPVARRGGRRRCGPREPGRSRDRHDGAVRARRRATVRSASISRGALAHDLEAVGVGAARGRARRRRRVTTISACGCVDPAVARRSRSARSAGRRWSSPPGRSAAARPRPRAGAGSVRSSTRDPDRDAGALAEVPGQTGRWRRRGSRCRRRSVRRVWTERRTSATTLVIRSRSIAQLLGLGRRTRAARRARRRGSRARRCPGRRRRASRGPAAGARRRWRRRGTAENSRAVSRWTAVAVELRGRGASSRASRRAASGSQPGGQQPGDDGHQRRRRCVSGNANALPSTRGASGAVRASAASGSSRASVDRGSSPGSVTSGASSSPRGTCTATRESPGAGRGRSPRSARRASIGSRPELRSPERSISSRSSVWASRYGVSGSRRPLAAAERRKLRDQAEPDAGDDPGERGGAPRSASSPPCTSALSDDQQATSSADSASSHARGRRRGGRR